MLGAIAGDIIGSVHEFKCGKTMDFPLFVAHSNFTDDSVLTVAVAECLLTGANYSDKLRELGYLLHATERNRLWFDQGCKRGRIYLHSLLGQAIEQFAARG